MERQLLVKPLGLITQPNKLGVFPPGAMSQAKDLLMRSPSILTQGFSPVGGWAALSQRPRLLHSTANQLIALERSSGGVWNVQWIVPSGPSVSAGALPYTSDSFSQTGHLQAVTLRGRTIINGGLRDPVVADFENPSTLAERTFRQAGLPQPHLTLQANSATNGQATEANTVVTYGAIYKREFSDYVLRSRPSAFVRVFTPSSPAPLNWTWRINIDESSPFYINAGDIVELYRSQSVPAPTGTTDDDSGTTLYLAARRTITSSDIGSGFIDVTDSTLSSAVGGPLGGLGEALYTNPDFGGLASGNDTPPVAACIASFRGRAWYSNCKFQAEFSWAYRRGLGELTTASQRANGVGRRTFTGTTSTVSPTVTGISAADMVGIAVGQLVQGAPAFFGQTIISVGASSFTMNANAAATGTQSGATEDILELDGVVFRIPNILIYGFNQNYVLTSSRSLYDKYQSVVDFKLRKLRYVSPATMTVRASNGGNYEPPIPTMSQTALTIQPTSRKNVTRWSHDGQPEAVPGTNEDEVGTGEIYATVPDSRDALWYFCSDGLFRLSGTVAPIEGIPDIRVDPIDSTLILAGPRAWCRLRDKIYAYTNRGLVAISDEGIIELTTGVIGDLLPGQLWVESETPYLLADSSVDEIFIMGAHATLNFVYSVRYGAFTTTSLYDGSLTGVQVASSMALVFGYSGSLLDLLPPAASASYLNGFGVGALQPVFGPRPDTNKQWIDATFIMERDGSNYPAFASFGGVDVSLGQNLVDTGNDFRATIGIPQDAPAVAPSLSPGFRVAGGAGGKWALSGISLRYVSFTEQQGAR